MSRPVRALVLWPWMTLLIASLGITAGIAWQVWPRPADITNVRAPVIPSQLPARPTLSDRRRVRLFFPQDSGETLKELEREIPRQATLAEEVRVTLHELGNDSLPEGHSPLPPGTEVRQVFLDAFGIVYLDFNKAIQAVTTSNGTRSELAISAIVTTLTTSFPEIKRVQFLTDGQELGLVSGGWELHRPVGPRFPGEGIPPSIPPSQE